MCVTVLFMQLLQLTAACTIFIVSVTTYTVALKEHTLAPLHVERCMWNEWQWILPQTQSLNIYIHFFFVWFFASCGVLFAVTSSIMKPFSATNINPTYTSAMCLYVFKDKWCNHERVEDIVMQCMTNDTAGVCLIPHLFVQHILYACVYVC